MRHTDKEMLLIKEELNGMWQLVLSQINKARQAFIQGDINLAREILVREKRVDLLELKIDRDCENYIALYSPVAVDLRLALSLMKIVRTLERIGDFAAGIAMQVIEADCQGLPTSLIEELRLERMFEVVHCMLADSYAALEHNTTHFSGQIIAQDEEVNDIYRQAPHVLTAFIQEHPEQAYCALKLLLLVRKIERIGDHCSNIVEEIVFYMDAKVIKHSQLIQD